MRGVEQYQAEGDYTGNSGENSGQDNHQVMEGPITNYGYGVCRR